MFTASQIIDGLGGTSAVARALSLTPSVVSSWRTANRIPRWRHADLIGLSGGKLSADDFPTRLRKAA